jgi:hypothetical protein
MKGEKNMTRYSTEQLKALNENELMALTEDFDKRAHEFSKEEMRIILDNLETQYKNIGLEVGRVEDLLEVIRYAMSSGYELLPEQLEAIKIAYEAYDLQDWERCRFALETFFQYENPENAFGVNLSGWNSKHTARWLTMLSATNLNEEPEGSPARIFFNRLSKKMESICLQ